jgi:hypothetical protein
VQPTELCRRKVRQATVPGRIDAQEARLQDLQRISVGYQQDVTAGVLSLQVSCSAFSGQ